MGYILYALAAVLAVLKLLGHVQVAWWVIALIGATPFVLSLMLVVVFAIIAAVVDHP